MHAAPVNIGQFKIIMLLAYKGITTASDIVIISKNLADIDTRQNTIIAIWWCECDWNRMILCICDSINYLNEDELDSFIECAFKHLNDNGRLIFDMHHINRLKEFEEEYIEEGYLEDMPYQWTINADNDSLHEHFTFYSKDGMMKEDHFQHVFKPETVINKLNRYFDVHYIEDFVPDEKVLFVNRKKDI